MRWRGIRGAARVVSCWVALAALPPLLDSCLRRNDGVGWLGSVEVVGCAGLHDAV